MWAVDPLTVEFPLNAPLGDFLAWLCRSYLSTISKPDAQGLDRYLSRDLF